VAVDTQPGVRPELRRVLTARTPADLADATLDLHAAHAADAHAGHAGGMTAAQYRQAYGPGDPDRPGPWPADSE
jgi:hypothetical protein